MSGPGRASLSRFGPLLLVLPAAIVLALVFLWPLGRLLGLSFSARAGAFAPYLALLTDSVYGRVFANTFTFAAVVTVVALAIGYPLAFALTRLRSAWRAALFACVLMPLWISVLVRTFSWMLLLERNGPVNRLIIGTGLTDRPLPLLFNQTGVLIGMVHVLLPYAVLPIYAALVRIDPALLRASEGLGASRVTTFLRVLLPLSLRGVATAATFVFLLSLGFFITPALLGGRQDMMIANLIDFYTRETLDWPTASAIAVVLLAVSLVLLSLLGRLGGRDRGGLLA